MGPPTTHHTKRQLQHMRSRASILAIGTELTTGQIINRNAAWISARLDELGIEVVLHETVADDRPAILAALDRCAAASDLLFVTGGLGPTSDDFTREVIADWSGRALKFHEPSWTKINDRLGAMGIPVAPSNRRQCEFPEGAEVIPNTEGTADAFALDHEDGAAGRRRLWVLPGPPREIEAVWKAAIDVDLRRRFPPRQALKLFTWQCLGKSEAELGEIVESALEGSGLRTGYRAHIPFVEVKVWCPETEISSQRSRLDRLEQAITPWIFSRQGEDMGATLLGRIAGMGAGAMADDGEIEIFDAATGGLLAERIGRLLRRSEHAALAPSVALVTEWVTPESPEQWVRNTLEQADPEATTLVLTGFTPDGRCAIGLRCGHTLRTDTLTSPWKHPRLLDRSRALATELAFKRWADWLLERLN